MFYEDHRPPHFHVRYAEHQAVVRIADLQLTEGHLPARALSLVAEWAASTGLNSCKTGKAIEHRQPLRKIEPLD